MARIILNSPVLVQRSLLSLTNQLIKAQQDAVRLRAIVDQITNNGAQKALLESNVESLLPVNTGTAIYDGIVSINTSLASLSTLVSAIDQSPGIVQ
jgi:hypothetical protein